jgi:hypothetical protein
VAATIVGIAAIQIGSDPSVAWAAAIGGFVLTFGLQAWWGRREALRGRPELFTPINPAPRP